MNSYIHAFLILFTVFTFSYLPHSHPVPKKTGKAGVQKMVFKSTDGGKTWQDISNGLPENLEDSGIEPTSIFATDQGLFLKDGSGLYHSTPDAKAPFWTKELLPEEQRNDAAGKSGIAAHKYWGINLKTTREKSIWSPMFEVSEMPRIGTNFETASGAIFTGTSTGYYKTADEGKTWKQVHVGGLVGHLAELNGILTAISMRKIIRSTDNGETWKVTAGEDSMAFDVKPIEGGFVAITASSESGQRRLSRSYDGGKSFQVIDVARNKTLVDSIGRTWNTRPNMKAIGTYVSQIGENLFSVHPDGVFRSSDNGKTWKLILPSVKDRGINILISGNVIYGIYALRGKGC